MDWLKIKAIPLNDGGLKGHALESRHVEPGRFRILVGGGSRDIRSEGDVTL